MKRIFKIIAALIVITLLLPAFTTFRDGSPSKKTEMRGLWVASVLNIDYPSKPTTNSETLKSEALKVLDNARDTGFNAVFLQVRPSADAFYKSQYFPWSRYLTGSQGQAPDNGFDPLAFWVDEAHKRGLQLHAWINPYRITKNPSDALSLTPTHPARLNPEWTVKYSDGNLYFNPGIPEVRNLIINSILEIVKNYAVDGIHMDDYFYPGNNFNDKNAFTQYGKNFKSIDDWRRANVNELVGNIYKAVNTASEKVTFGISPFGIWANKYKNSLGSDTRGGESYYDHYADTRKWVKEGMIDYIAPQLYWNIGFSAADYSKLLSWWADTVRGTGVDLYIGQASYLSGNTNPTSAWYGISEIVKQMQLNSNTPEVKGSIFFSYKSTYSKPAVTSAIKALYAQRDGVSIKNPVTISRPSENIKTSYKTYYLNGESDPGKPLYLNGKEITGRSAKGYYGELVQLQEGANFFTVSQEGSFSSRAIYRYPAQAPAQMSSAAIPVSSTFPQSQEYRTSGEKITLSCQAPIGSSVSVKIGGKTFAMKPSSNASYGSGIYPTTFTLTYIIPSFTTYPRNIDLGKPVYSMTYKGRKVSVTAPGAIGVIIKNSPFYAQVNKKVIDTYAEPVSGNGAAFELYQGMTDYITGMTGSYIRLSSGQWVKNYDVKTYSSKYQFKPSIGKVSYTAGAKWDSFILSMSNSPVATASFDGTALKLEVSNVTNAPLPTSLPYGSPFSGVSKTKKGSSVEYVFKLKNNSDIEGYYIQKTSSGITLYIKKPIGAASSNKPLTGITIMVDPGHGGSETGAIGPLGLRYCEKDINLKTALKLRTELENKGAKVLMTRTTDNTVSLAGRLGASRDARPDMFISIHANSMEDNVDISKISGFSLYYREALAKTLADTLYNNEIESLNRKAMGVRRANYYVTRGTWTPSILVETGFVPNPDEFEWLTDENSQTVLAKSLADGVVKYFSRPN